MDDKLDTACVYTAADVFDMKLTVDRRAKLAVGHVVKEIDFGKLAIPVQLTMVSNLFGHLDYMYMVRGLGNVALFLSVGRGKRLTHIHILNIAKMDKVEGWLELKKPKDAQDTLALLGKAVVASFEKTGKNKWTRMPR